MQHIIFFARERDLATGTEHAAVGKEIAMPRDHALFFSGIFAGLALNCFWSAILAAGVTETRVFVGLSVVCAILGWLMSRWSA